VTQFLLDAQLSRQLVARLIGSGHQASHVYDHLDPQADDRAIAELANSRGASVVSKGADFADLARRGILLRTLVWLRVPNLANDALWLRLEAALPAIVSAAEANEPVVEVL
jgi:predicted nuclease of predicted toxin-antitoxin system